MAPPCWPRHRLYLFKSAINNHVFIQRLVVYHSHHTEASPSIPQARKGTHLLSLSEFTSCFGDLPHDQYDGDHFLWPYINCIWYHLLFPHTLHNTNKCTASVIQGRCIKLYKSITSWTSCKYFFSLETPSPTAIRNVHNQRFQTKIFYALNSRVEIHSRSLSKSLERWEQKKNKCKKSGVFSMVKLLQNVILTWNAVF